MSVSVLATWSCILRHLRCIIDHGLLKFLLAALSCLWTRFVLAIDCIKAHIQEVVAVFRDRYVLFISNLRN